MKFKFFILLCAFFSVSLTYGQKYSDIHSFALNYSGLYVSEGIAKEPLYGNGVALHYQYFNSSDFAYGLQLSYAMGTENFDIYGDENHNDYEVINYLFTIRYNLLPESFKIYLGMNLGGNVVNVKTTWEAQGNQQSHGMIIGVPVGINWFATKHIFVTAGFNSSIMIGSSLYVSDAILGANAGIGYYFGRKHSKSAE